MNTLTVDIGNSRTKIDSWTNSGFLSEIEAQDFSAEEILKEASLRQADAIIISTVRYDSGQLTEKLKESGLSVVKFDNEEIRRHYQLKGYKGRIGTDRIAAWLGAKSLFPEDALLIADAGTALTIDLSDPEGDFCGGNISLGLKTRLQALSKATAQLPLVDLTGEYSGIGHDTSSAIINGALNGITAEVIFMNHEAKNKFENIKVVITGGDGKLLQNELRKAGYSGTYDPYLVGRGLNHHLRTFY